MSLLLLFQAVPLVLQVGPARMVHATSGSRTVISPAPLVLMPNRVVTPQADATDAVAQPSSQED